jgi:hypothetical protein
MMLGAMAAVLALGVLYPAHAAPAGNATKVLYRTSFRSDMSRWTAGGGKWTLQGGMLTYSGVAGSVVLAPYSAPRTHYAVEAVIKLVAWRDTGLSESNGFGLLLRARGPVDPTAATAGLMAGVGRGFLGCDGLYSQPSIATADTDLSALKQTSDRFRPGRAWHTYRVEVQGNTIKLLIDGHSRETVVTKQYAGATRVGLFSLGSQLQVKSFSIMQL